MTDVDSKLSIITKQLEEIANAQKVASNELNAVKTRLDSLEKKSPDKSGIKGKDKDKVSAPSSSSSDAGTGSGTKEILKGSSTSEFPPDKALIPKKSDESRQDFEAIKDSLIRVRLPNTYRLSENRSSIPSKDREQAAVLVRSSKFVETNLKLLGEIQNSATEPFSDVVADLLDNLLTVNAAAIRYLKEEYSSLYVGGEYRPKTKSVFKSLRKNTSNLEPDAIEDLKTAVQVTQPQNQNPKENFGGFKLKGGFKTYGRGHGGYRGRGGTGYQQKSVPFQRDTLPTTGEE